MISPILLLLASVIAAEAPQIHSVKGIVTDARSRAPIYGATISLQNGKRIAVTDKKGQFRIELPEVGWPPGLVVAAPGHAPQTVPLPHIPNDADLKTVALSVAARLHVRLLPMFASDKVSWRLMRLMGGKPIALIQEGTFAPGKTETTIEGLPATNYLLIVRGEGPLQQHAVKTSTSEGQTTELLVTITPMLLELTVQSGDRPESGAVVQFIQHDQEWGGTVSCDDRGKAREELWQSGDFFVGIKDRGRTGFTRLAHLESETGTVSWTFDIPAHRVTGRVIDSLTREPLRDVRMTLQGTAPREGGLEGLHAGTDDNGRFEFRGIQEGEHSLRAYRKGYRYDQLQHFEIKKDDEDYEIEIPLEAILDPHALIVGDATGAPIVNAGVFFAGASGVQPLERTDNAGRVALPPHTAGVAFAVPGSGSFAFAQISADISEDFTLRVPPANGSIEVISQSTSGEAIPNVFFVMRVNGTMIPPEVMGHFATLHGLTFRTDATGHALLRLLPQGLYDLWPVRSREDVAMLFSGNPPQPAASVALGNVPQVVTMTFKKKPAG